MEHIVEQTNNLVKAVKESKEYLLYRQLLDQILEDQELYSQVNDFRRKSILIQLSTDNNLLDNSSALYAEYSSLLNINLVSEFLSAEQAYCRIIREMNNQIMESLDLDIDFLED